MCLPFSTNTACDNGSGQYEAPAMRRMVTCSLRVPPRALREHGHHLAQTPHCHHTSAHAMAMLQPPHCHKEHGQGCAARTRYARHGGGKNAGAGPLLIVVLDRRAVRPETRLYLEVESDCAGLLPSCAAPAVRCQLLISLTREPRLAANRPMEGKYTSWHARGVRPRRPCGRSCEI